MEFGVHLPLADLGGGFSLRSLQDYASAAADLGYTHLCANDHLVFSRPWLDGPTALAAVVDRSGDMRLATTVGLPVIRGPAVLASTLTALHLLSEGRVVAGVGPGSSAADYALVGVPFEERWSRFDDALRSLRTHLQGSGIPVWVASWGSPAGLRRAARLGDGWIASAYNASPEQFGERLRILRGFADGRPMPSALATAWTYVTEDPAEAERMLTDTLAPMLRRPADSLRHLPIGPAEVCAERLAAFAAAGVERVFLWPLADEVRQLELVRERVVPLVSPG
jgi:alkanesulfonate monooxygenase SsuD/methylene tetrahydromethanopterin reductase-like flavin-dependent oxidoreductase (luciferase family)